MINYIFEIDCIINDAKQGVYPGEEEIKILEDLKDKIKALDENKIEEQENNERKVYAYIARDKWGGLYIYTNGKPNKGTELWFAEKLSDFSKINNDLFPQIKWEDENPTKVSIEIVDKQEQQPQE